MICGVESKSVGAGKTPAVTGERMGSRKSIADTSEFCHCAIAPGSRRRQNPGMFSTRELRISATGVQSLVWNGDELIDWAGGGTRFSLDGETVSNPVSYGDTFDAAAMSPSGEFAVTYTRLGTKGLVLHRGKIIREINRSYYHADVYEYPIALARLKNGREVLIHCPEEYCRLEIDDVQSGERLTDRRSRKPADFFQSRLAVSADGRTLASAGWSGIPWTWSAFSISRPRCRTLYTWTALDLESMRGQKKAVLRLIAMVG